MPGARGSVTIFLGGDVMTGRGIDETLRWRSPTATVADDGTVQLPVAKG